MKTKIRFTTSTPSSPSPRSSVIHLALTLAAAVCLALPWSVLAQKDNFDDGNDDGWTRFDPLALVFGAPQAEFTFPDGAYRIKAKIPPAQAAGPGRAGSVRLDVTYTNFYVSVDVINWDDTVRQAFGILARVQQLGLGTLDCYAFTYERGAGVTPTSGDFDISVVVDEQPTGQIENEPSGYHLEAGKSYRFVFMGQGPLLEARVYELPNVNEPVLVLHAQDGTYSSGACGLVVFDNSGDDPPIAPDATFDNYFATDVIPPRLNIALDFDTIVLSWPTDPPGFILQSTHDLGPTATWIDLGPGFPVGNTNQYIEADLTNRMFYRLIRR